MIIEFYTGKENQFVVLQDKIFRNGEVIAEGRSVTIHHLVMNEPSWLLIEKGEEIPPLYLKTDKVTAVLPNNEFFNGKRCSRKDFKVSFLARIQNSWVKSEEVVSAVNEIHVKQILKVKYGSIANAMIECLTPNPILV